MLATSKTLSSHNNLRATPCHGMVGWSNLPFPTFLRQQLLPAPVGTIVICQRGCVTAVQFILFNFCQLLALNRYLT